MRSTPVKAGSLTAAVEDRDLTRLHNSRHRPFVYAIMANTHYGGGQLQSSINKRTCFAGVAHPHQSESSVRIMLAFKWLSLLALTAFAATDVPELVVDKTYVPADCTVRSVKGDKIRVSYVSGISLLIMWLTVTHPPPILQTGKLTNGNKFDSRYVQRASLRD